MSDVPEMLEIFFNDDIQMTNEERITLLLEVVENITDEYIVVSDIARSCKPNPSDLKRIETSNDWVADQMMLAKKVEFDLEEIYEEE